MSIIAFTATASTAPGSGPGILISDYDPNGGVHVDLATIDGDPGEDEYGDLDEDSADAILKSAGYVRTGAWQYSGAQWGADVERDEGHSGPVSGREILAALESRNCHESHSGYNWQNG